MVLHYIRMLYQINTSHFPMCVEWVFRSNQISEGIYTAGLKEDAVIFCIKKVKLIKFYVNSHFTPANL